MYAKLFSRIAQSSLMEEKVNTRYVFMMMLALSDRHGEVIGTDVAISRMMNVPKNDFCDALKPLLEADLDSNSPAEEGRRIILSENGRGYKIVNYLNYRDMKSDDEKREYMRQYMKRRRDKTKENDENLNSVNPCKVLLNDVTHTEAEAEADTKKNKKPSFDDTFDFCNKIGLTRTDAEYMQDKWLETGFKNNEKPIKDWQAQIRNWKRMSYLPSTKQKPAMRSINEPSQLRSFP
jgi:hypothetical protein